MKIKQIESGDVKKFVVSDTTASFANALRRTCSFEVPVLAVEDVYFVKNSSALYDEIIAHRLGLIPLKTDLKSFNLAKNCKCKTDGCALCQVKLILKVKGPCIVYAKDFKSADLKVKPIFPETPVVELLEGQEIELEAIAVLGQGKEHSKWSAGHSFYHRYPKITVGSGKKVKDGMDKCPKNVFKAGKVANLQNCDLCRACQEYSAGAIQAEGEDDRFVFTLEPWGQLSAKEILQEAVKILEQKTKEVKIK